MNWAYWTAWADGFFWGTVFCAAFAIRAVRKARRGIRT